MHPPLCEHGRRTPVEDRECPLVAVKRSPRDLRGRARPLQCKGNLALSQARAASVVAAQQPQLPGVTLTPDGRGETELVAEETTETVRTTRSRGR